MKHLARRISLALPTLGAAVSVSAQTAFAINTQTNIDAPTGFASNVGSLINAVLRFVMLLAALLVFLYLIWGGIEWITSGGDKGKTENARNKITAAVIGLVILAASYAVLSLALNFLGFTDLNQAFNEGLKSINEK